MGTPAYMAPEMAEGRQDLVDARTDVYVLGAGLVEIVTGRPPYHGRSEGSGCLEAIRTVNRPGALHQPSWCPQRWMPSVPGAMARERRRSLPHGIGAWAGRPALAERRTGFRLRRVLSGAVVTSAMVGKVNVVV